MKPQYEGSVGGLGETPSSVQCRSRRIALRPDGDAFHLEGKLVAHYHFDPEGSGGALSL